MGIGSPDIAERGRKTRFTGENAAEMGKRGNAAWQANAPIRKCLKQLATDALYGHPPVSNDTLSKVAKFFKIKSKEVTFAHVAVFKQATEMAKGDPGAFNLLAAYAGEKPADKVEISSPDFTDLQAAFSAEQQPTEAAQDPDGAAPAPAAGPDPAGPAGDSP